MGISHLHFPRYQLHASLPDAQQDSSSLQTQASLPTLRITGILRYNIDITERWKDELILFLLQQTGRQHGNHLDWLARGK